MKSEKKNNERRSGSYWPVLRLTIPEGEMEFGVLGVPGDAEEAGVAGVAEVIGLAGAGGGERGVGTALNASSFWNSQKALALDSIKTFIFWKTNNDLQITTVAVSWHFSYRDQGCVCVCSSI